MSQVVPYSQMTEVTVEELRQMASDCRESIWARAESMGREPKIYLHWTAGRYSQFWDDYHVQIDSDGKIYMPPDVTLADDSLPATWRRNTGSVAITLLCGFNSTSNDLGSMPPTAEQIESMAQAICAVADGLWLTIDKVHVLTHGEAANNEDGIYPHPAYAWWNDEEGDGDTRGDLEFLGTPESPCYNPWAEDGTRGGDVLRGKAQWYREHLHGNNDK